MEINAPVETFANFCIPRGHRQQIVLLADTPVTRKTETLLELKHGFKTSDAFSD
jgi:hypothetical protein